MKITRNVLSIAGLICSTATAVGTVLKLMRRIDFRNKVVVITGGSRGLGLNIARRLADEGARLAIIARDEKEMRIACEELNEKTETHYFVCDVTNEEQVSQTMCEVIGRFGTVDVLINNAGVIQVGPVETMGVEDFKTSMDNHFFAPLYTTLAALPEMRRKRFGRIVNISSIGGKISVPHLVPYTASKFALVGFSTGMRAELMKENILVTTVCPGLMRTGSHLQANFKGQNEKEYAWFSTLNALPLISTSADESARQIVEACREGDAELVISTPAAWASRVTALLPETTSNLLGLINRVLPGADGTNKNMLKGKDSQSEWSPNVLTAPIEKAALENNQWSEEKVEPSTNKRKSA